jgi:hypothetical protein
MPGEAENNSGRQIAEIVGGSGAQSVAFTSRLNLSSSRNSTPPQRIHIFRGFAIDIDITIPHEHSRTAIAHSCSRRQAVPTKLH